MLYSLFVLINLVRVGIFFITKRTIFVLSFRFDRKGQSDFRPLQNIYSKNQNKTNQIFNKRILHMDIKQIQMNLQYRNHACIDMITSIDNTIVYFSFCFRVMMTYLLKYIKLSRVNIWK